MADDSYYDAVVLATPANLAGGLLEGVDAALANDLLGVTYSSSVTVALGYYMEQLEHLPPGFGFLVPRSEGTRMLACTFVHNKFPHRTPPNMGLLRCFLGGARDEAVLSLSDDELLATVRKELRNFISLSANPIFARVYRWRGAMAQYESGHIARVERIEKRVGEIPGLALAGNAFHGIGVPDCIRSGQQAAEAILRSAVESLAHKN
jgi:oxygen-dependent protoporphyrinogen oxidase